MKKEQILDGVCMNNIWVRITQTEFHENDVII